MLKQNKAFIPIVILIVILVSIVLGWWLSLPRGDELPSSISISPTETEESGIPIGAGFVVKSNFAVSEPSLRALLALEPAINYQLSGGGKEWKIQPVMPMKENTVYTFRVNNSEGTPVQSFAFQTRTDLLIQSVFPQEKESYVDVNTGIEIKFNRPGVDLSQGFEILPAVSGKFETLEYACRFIPDQPLENNSIYRITLKGLRSQDNAVLTEPITYMFTTAEEEGKESWDDINVASDTESLLPGGDPRVAIWGSDTHAKTSFTMTLHKYAGIKVYEAALRQRDAFYREQYGIRQQYRIPTVGLDEVMNVKSPLMYSNGDLYAPLPKNLSEGYYLFTLHGEGSETQKEQFAQQLIQVVNLSVYTQSINEDTLFWIGDPVSGRPTGGVEIAVDTNSGKHMSGTTGSDGTLLLNTASEESAYALITREGTPVWIAPVPLSPKSEEKIPLSTQYYAGLYTDREIYQPGEEISFWGVVKPRTKQNMPTELNAAIVTHWPHSTISETTVQIAADGTFNAKIRPETLQAGGYALELRNAEGEAYLDHFIEISEYTKPAYEITLNTDKEFYYFGETVNFSVEAHYYDGTPAAGVKLRAECYNARVQEYSITLDAQGKASFKSVLDPSTSRTRGGVIGYWEPQNIGWSVQSADEQAVNLYENQSFLALPSKIGAEIEYQGGGKAKISAAFIDESKIFSENNSEETQTQFEKLKGNPADIPMTFVIHRATWTQKQSGSYFDPVNKENIPVYETTREEVVERSIPISTSMGSAIIENLPVSGEENVSYWYELRFAGGVYGDVCTTAYPFELERRQGESTYTFFADSSPKKMIPGTPLDIGIYENGTRPQSAGTVLYSLVQNDLVTYGTYNQNVMTLEIKKEYLPNIMLTGVYFDGNAMHPIENSNISYEYTQEILQVEIKTDKESYRPGEDMQVTLLVKDADGKPVSGQAAVGVVDESIFDISPQAVNLARQLYMNVYYPSITTSMTKSPSADGGKDMMYSGSASPESAKFPASMSNDMASPNTGGGGMSRSVFADTAAFEIVTLAADGTGKATLTLPHNITSWRVTAAAVTPRLQAGDTTTNASATLPFYLMPIVSDLYLVGDDISVSVLSAGTTLVTETGEIEYTATLTGGKRTTPLEQKANATVNARATFSFGKLEAGSYRVKFTGNGAGNQDAIEVPLTVVESGLLTPIIKTVDLSLLTSVKSDAWPVQVTVFSETAKPMFDTLSWLSSQNGQRAEMMVASARAQEIYRELLPPDQRQAYTRDERFSLLLSGDGGVAPLPKAASDSGLTAKMLIAAPELIKRSDSVTYLQNTLKSPASILDDRIMAYVGLAAAKEPVLLDLRRLYQENLEILKPYQTLYIGAAFARLGDFEQARTIYDSVRMMKSGNLVYTDGADQTQTTAAALLLASEIGHNDAHGLANFLMRGATDSGKEGVLWHLELLSYAKTLRERGIDEGKFTWENGGKTEEVSLEQGSHAMMLDSQSLQNGKFRTNSGKLYAAVQVWQPGNSTANGEFAEITKTYEAVDGGTIKPGSRVKVTTRIKFKEDAPYGIYTLSDYIPSGLRWLSLGETINGAKMSIWPMLSQDGQKISGSLYHSKPEVPGDPTPYPIPVTKVNSAYVRVLSEMVQAAESSVISSSASRAASNETMPNVEDVPKTDSEIAMDDVALTQEDSVSDGDVDANDEQVLPDIEPHEEPAVEAPQAQIAPPSPPIVTPKKPQVDDYDVIIEYYLTAALPGSFITESTWLTMDGQTAKSERGIISVKK